MKITTTYSSVKSIRYEFDEHEIFEALKRQHGLDDPGGKLSKDSYFDDNCNLFFIVTVDFIAEKDGDEFAESEP